MSADIVRSHLEGGEWALAREAATLALEGCGADERGPLLALLARVRARLGMPREALGAAEEAAAVDTSPEIQLALAEAWIAVGRAHAARALLTEVLDAVRSASAGDATASPERELAIGCALAEACRAAGDPEAGVGVAARMVAVAEERCEPDGPWLAEALHELGVCLHGAGHPGKAAASLSRALAIRRRTAPGTVLVALTLDALGRARRKGSEPLEATRLHREALALWIAALGAPSGCVAACRHSLAQAVHNTGDFATARDEMHLAWLATARTLGPDHVDTHITAFELGRFELDVGRAEEGIRRMEDARAEVSRTLGRDHPVVRAMDRWL